MFQSQILQIQANRPGKQEIRACTHGYIKIDHIHGHGQPYVYTQTNRHARTNLLNTVYFFFKEVIEKNLLFVTKAVNIYIQYYKDINIMMSDGIRRYTGILLFPCTCKFMLQNNA